MQVDRKKVRRVAVGSFILVLTLSLALVRSYVVFIYAIAFVVMLLLMAFYSVRQQFTNVAEQHERASNTCDDFFLLLRPFDLSNYQRTTFIKSELRHWSEPELPATIISDTMISKLEQAIRGTATLVAVGDSFTQDKLRFDHRIILLSFEEARWQEIVQILAKYSRAILLLPNTSDGVLKEMEIIQTQDLWKKTIIIMPPLHIGGESQRLFGGGSYIVYGQELKGWERIRNELMRYNYAMPEAVESGMIFTVNKDFSRQNVAHPKSWDGCDLAEAINTLIPHLDGERLPLNKAYNLLEPSTLKNRPRWYTSLLKTPDRACHFVYQFFSLSSD